MAVLLGRDVILVISFVMLGALWPRPLLAAHAARRALPAAVSRASCSARSGSSSRPSASRSSASSGPRRSSGTRIRSGTSRRRGSTWSSGSGCPCLSVVLGNVWRALSPWRAIADAFVWIRERGGGRGAAARRVPRAARALARSRGALRVRRRWSSRTAIPRARAHSPSRSRSTRTSPSSGWPRSVAIHGSATARRSRCCSASSPCSRRSMSVDGRIRLRWPLTGLAGADRAPGTVAFVSVMLGAVLFDGFSRTATWQDLMVGCRGAVPS